MSTTEEIKTCPNPGCNKSSIIRCNMRTYKISKTDFAVSCYGCCCRGPFLYTEADAIAAWNAMPRREEIHAELMALKTTASTMGSMFLLIDHLAEKYKPEGER